MLQARLVMNFFSLHSMYTAVSIPSRMPCGPYMLHLIPVKWAKR